MVTCRGVKIIKNSLRALNYFIIGYQVNSKKSKVIYSFTIEPFLLQNLKFFPLLKKCIMAPHGTQDVCNCTLRITLKSITNQPD